MEIKPQYLERYLHDIAINQLVADYQAKGYEVSHHEKIGKYRPDLVAKKGDEVVIVEVKAGKMTSQKRRQVAEIGDFVRTQKNYKFLVVVAIPPKPKRIVIPNIEELLFNHIIGNPPQELNRLSSHTRITDVSEATVDEVTVNEDGNITAKGNGTVDVELQYGSGKGDNGAITSDVFPFNFEVVLKYNEHHELILDSAKELDVDVSPF